MKALLTGAAGFIGSHLAERLIREGHDVVGVDAFTEYYERSLKERNVQPLLGSPGFRFVEADLTSVDLGDLLQDRDVIFHLAAQPGVRSSWGSDFRIYLERNLWATQRLLEAVRDRPLRKFVFASSSSVYGDAERYPTAEDVLPQPISPYGVSKLAGERLCLAYARSYGVPVMAMRYFTVYGPRQRPDMAFNRFIQSLLHGNEITIYGDGTQSRDFTYVSDAVQATLQAALVDVTGAVMNVGGGSRVTLLEIMDLLHEATGDKPRVHFMESQRGDVRDTAADVTRATHLIGYRPEVPLFDGLCRQVEFQRDVVVETAAVGVERRSPRHID